MNKDQERELEERIKAYLEQRGQGSYSVTLKDNYSFHALKNIVEKHEKPADVRRRMIDGFYRASRTETSFSFQTGANAYIEIPYAAVIDIFRKGSIPNDAAPPVQRIFAEHHFL